MEAHLRVEGISYLVCATQRSGSTLLCELRGGRGTRRVLREAAGNWPGTPTAAILRGPLRTGHCRATDADGAGTAGAARGVRTVVALRAPAGHHSQWCLRRQDDVELPRRNSGSGWRSSRVWATCRSTSASRPSFPDSRSSSSGGATRWRRPSPLWKAIQTRQWRTESETGSQEVDTDGAPDVDYDYQAIEYLLKELHQWDAHWEDWFHATGREPIRVFYDEFTVSRAGTIGRVLDALGVDPPAPEGKKSMKRQADDLSEDWVTRFRTDRERRQRI